MSIRRCGKLCITAVVLAVVTVAAVSVVLMRSQIRSWALEQPYRTSLPSAEPARALPKSIDTPLPTAEPPHKELDQEVNLAVPFAPQAPHANWDQPYQDACEEAVVIMVERFYRGAALSLSDMDAEILQMVEFQNTQYGFYRDSNIAETVQLVEAFYPHLSAKARYNITADDIRAALVQRIPVVVLANGRKLGNPFYTQPGPDKHALVIKGVKGNSFITNDPGTRRGADFVYPIETVMNAIIDYDSNTPGTGKKAMILITPKLTGE